MSDTKKSKTFCVSDETINCYGLRVLTDGIDTSAFALNPVMFYMHRRGKVFGSWLNLESKDGKLFAAPEFDIASGDDEIKFVAGQVDRDVIKAASIGIEIDYSQVVRNEALNCYDVPACILTEISIVDVGGNKNALRLYKNGEPVTELQLSAELATLDTSTFKPTPVIMNLAAIATALGLAATATEQEVQLAANQLAKDASYKKEFETLTASIELAKTKEATTLVDQAIADKRIPASSKDSLLTLFKSDFDAAKLVLSNMAKPVDLAQFATTGQAVAVSTSASTLDLAKEWDSLQKAPGSPLLELKRASPEKYKQLYKAKYGTEPTLVTPS